jgi:predicted DNA-binding transcriptional regulator AlpA
MKPFYSPGKEYRWEPSGSLGVRAQAGRIKMEGAVKEAEAMIDEGAVAARMGVSKRTLQNMRCRREGPPFVKIGALVRYKIEDVERYIEQRRVQTGSRFIGPGHAGLSEYFERYERRTPVEGARTEAAASHEGGSRAESASSQDGAVEARGGNSRGGEPR